MAFADWSTSAASNAATLGVSIAEGCPPGNVNDAIRKAMSDLRSAINPALDSFLSQSSLSAARTALGVESSTDANTALGALTPAANKVPYFTGASSAALADFTSFGRSLVALGDAASLASLISAITLSSVTFGTNTISLSIVLSSSHTLLIQGGTGSLAGDTTDTITFPTAYSTAPVCLVTGGSSNVSHEGDVHPSAAASTTGIAICNSNGSATCTYTWLSIGKA